MNRLKTTCAIEINYTLLTNNSIMNGLKIFKEMRKVVEHSTESQAWN